MKQDPLVYVIDRDDGDRQVIERQLEESNLEFQSFRDADSFLSALARSRLGCVLTELRLGGSTALQLVHRVHNGGSSLPVVLVTSQATVPLTVQAFKAGLFDVLEKPTDGFRLWECVTRAFESHGRALSAAHHRNRVRNLISQLSNQELQVLRMLLDGEPNKRIAAQLRLSPRTIVFRRKSLMQKMNAKSVADLACLVHSLTGDGSQAISDFTTLLDVHMAASITETAERLHAKVNECSPATVPIARTMLPR